MYELLYTSNSRSSFSKKELERLLQQARDKNQQLNITGMLVYQNNTFMQILEGEEECVKSLFDVIKNDQRHSSLALVYEGPVFYRSFSRWSMAFKYIEPHQLTPNLLIGSGDRIEGRAENILSLIDQLGYLVKSSPNLGKELFLSLAED